MFSCIGFIHRGRSGLSRDLLCEAGLWMLRFSQGCGGGGGRGGEGISEEVNTPTKPYKRRVSESIGER